MSSSSLEHLLAAVFDSADESLNVYDLDGRLLAWNAASLRIFGYTAGDLADADRSSRPRIDPDAQPNPVFGAIAQLKAGADVVRKEFETTRKDGTRVRINVAFTPLRSGEKLEAILASARDVTEHHRLLEDLRNTRASETLLASIVQSSHDAVFSRDPTGRILSWNRAAEQLYGYSAQEIIGQRWTRLVPPEELTATLARAQTVSAGRPLIDSHQTNLRKDGTRAEVSITVSPIAGPDGKEIGASIIARDLTERRSAEQTQRSLEEALRSKDDQLRAAQKMEAVGSLAGGVAHDFNNLLSIILSSSLLGLKGLTPHDPLHRELTDINHAAERAATLTQQLLAFGRRQVLSPTVLDLADVVHELEPMLRRLIGENLELKLSAPKSLAPVLADRGQLGQVLVNLVVNARDAMPQGGRLTVEVSEKNLDAEFAAGHLGVQEGPHLLLSVADTGTGMSAETLARLFEPFFTTKGERGTGLGLATVFGIVQQSGGTIWVDSAVGKGSTFSIYLPRTDRALQPRTVAPEPSALKGNETVLLVEDEPKVRTVVRTVLETAGYHVLEAQGPGDALILSEQHGEEIDLLVSDVVMPRLSGQQLAQRLHANRPDMRVLYMSGYTDQALVLDGGIDFISKPIRPEALLKKVRTVLDAASPG